MNESLKSLEGAIKNLKINYTSGAYHKPLVLGWMMSRVLDGEPRLVSSRACRRACDPVLTEISGASSNSAWPLLKLKNDLGLLWVVDGADPSADPPADFVAGWTLSAYQALREDPRTVRDLLGLLTGRYLQEVSSAVTPLIGVVPRSSR